MRQFQIIYIIIFIITAIGQYSCKKPASTASRNDNYAYLYNPTVASLHPTVQVFHSNDSISELVVKLFPDELLFNKANKEGVMRAFISLTFFLQEINKDSSVMNNAIDTVSFTYTLDKEEINKRYYVSTLFKAYRGKQYYLTCDIQDINRRSKARKFVYVDKSDKYGYQNYRVVYDKTEHLVFDPKIIYSEKVRIKYSDPSVTKLYVKFYKDYQKIPPPAYVIFSEPNIYPSYDSLFVYDLTTSQTFHADQEGLYLFQSDTAVQKGLSVTRFYEGYPKIDDPLQMIRPLEFLESPPKYRELLGSNNMKLAVDDYWLNIATDNVEKARQLIRIYYNRVFFANYYFTSYKEGWMTDRGKVFLIYGHPDIIYKDVNTENWIYYGQKREKVIDFVFERKNVPFCDNHFILVRNNGNTFWNEAIVSWRRGVVFSADNI